MSLIQTPWTSQPQQAVGINWSNSLSRGITSVYLPSVGVSLICSGPTTQGGTSRVTANSGVGRRFQGGVSTDFIGYGTADSLFGQNRADGSIVSLLRYTDTTLRDAQLFGQSSDGGASNRILVQHWSDGKIYFDWGGATNGAGRISATVSKTLNPFVISAISSASSGKKLWIDKQKVAENGADFTAFPSSSAEFRLGNIYSNWISDACEIYLAVTWNRPLSDLEHKRFVDNPWQIFKPLPRRTLFVSSGALPSLAVTANLASAVGSMAFKSQPTFAVSGATAAVQGLMSFGPASRLAVNATTGDTVGSMDFKAQPVFGVAATTGQTLGSMAFKAQPSLGVNAATAPAVGAMSFGAASRLSVSATLAPTVGSMAFVAQPKFAVVAQTASVQGLMSFGPSSRQTVNAVTDPTVGSMAFKSLPTLAVNAQTVPTIGSMTFAVSPRFGVLAALAPTLGNMRFISGDMPNDSPGRFDIHVSRKVTFDCTIARTVNFKVEVVNRG